MLRFLRKPTLALAGVLLVLGGCGSPTKPPAPSPLTTDAVWAVSSSGTERENYFQEVAVDTVGNVYGVDYLYGEGTVTFGTVSATGTVDGYNAFLVKFDASGTAHWARSVLSAPASVWFYGVATDSTGNVYVAGSTFGPGTFDFGTEEDPVTVAGPVSNSYNALLVKYDSAGVAQWARSALSATEGSSFNAVAVDASDNVYVAGSLYERGEFEFGDGETLTSLSDTDVLLVRYDTSGTAQWARTGVTAVSDNSFSAVATDAEGNIYAAGSLYGAGLFEFGNEANGTSSSASGNAVIVKYDASGAALWARTSVSGSSSTGFSGLALDGSGHVYAVGETHGTDSHDWGGGVTAAGSYPETNALIVQYDTSGTPHWARSVAGSAYSKFYAAAVHSGHVFAVGSMGTSTSYDFGGAVVSGSGMYNNAVIVRYDAAGTAGWVQSSSSGSLGSAFFGLAARGGLLYAAGSITGTDSYQFGSAATSPGSSEGTQSLLVKYQ